MARPLWARVGPAIANFLTLCGATVRSKARESKKRSVKCDPRTMTQTDIDEGRPICFVGVAPVKPAEFVIVSHRSVDGARRRRVSG